MTTADPSGWRALRKTIHRRILDGTYGPGTRLPRDADLAQELGCARTTVQRAMRALADEGLIERRRRGGTRVRAHPVTRATFDIPVVREEVAASGRAYGYRLVGREISEAPQAIAAAMGLAAPERMLRAQALHLADGQPFMYEDRWISLATVPEIAAVDLQPRARMNGCSPTALTATTGCASRPRTPRRTRRGCWPRSRARRSS